MTTEVVKRTDKTSVEVAALSHLAPRLVVRNSELTQGGLKMVGAVVKLSPDDYSTIGRGDQAKRLLSPSGAAKLNAVAGVEIIHCPKLNTEIVDATGYTSVTRWGMAVGWSAFKRVWYGPISYTFQPKAYLEWRLAKLAQPYQSRQDREAGRPAPLAPVLILPDAMKPDRPGSWVFHGEPGKIGLWVNHEDREVVGMMIMWYQDRTTALVRCQNVLERNLLVRGPWGLPKHPSSDSVNVITWMPDHPVPDEEVRRLHDAMAASDDPRSLIPAGDEYVAPKAADAEDLDQFEEDSEGESDMATADAPAAPGLAF